ncbi:MAG: hypothetical protein R2875_12200 [Desulfobacterales bacterium]
MCWPRYGDPTVRADAIHDPYYSAGAVFLFTGGMLSAVQFAKEQFTIPALALIYNLGIIGGGSIFLYGYLGMAGFSWGCRPGRLSEISAVQIWAPDGPDWWFSLLFDITHPDFRKYILLTCP